MMPFALFLAVAFLILGFILWQVRVRSQREAHISSFILPKGLYDRLRTRTCQMMKPRIRKATARNSARGVMEGYPSEHFVGGS